MVKLVKLFVVLAFLSPVCYGQEGGKFITFNTSEYDFGEVDEGSRPLSYTFMFRNSSSALVELAAPVSSCSCVNAKLSTRSLEPGQTGELEVIFDPSGASFRTYRTVDVYSRDGSHIQTISVSAYVNPSDSGISERYPVVLAEGLRATRSELSFGYLYWGESSLKTIGLVNTSTKPVRVRARVLSPERSRLKFDCPQTIGPGSEELVRLEYAMPASPHDYMSASDTLVLLVDGQKASTEIHIDYILMGRLPKTADQPSMRTCPSVAKLSKGPLSRKYSGTVELFNDGPGVLEIYAVNGDAQSSLRPGTLIEAGEGVKVKASSTQDSFRLELFTNDPLRPYKELIFQY